MNQIFNIIPRVSTELKTFNKIYHTSLHLIEKHAISVNRTQAFNITKYGSIKFCEIDGTK